MIMAKFMRIKNLLINYKEVLINSKINFIPYMIDYSNNFKELSHKTIQFGSVNIKKPIVFERGKPINQIQNILDKICNI